MTIRQWTICGAMMAVTAGMLSSCGGKETHDAMGTFEATEVTVSAQTSGTIVRFDAEEGDRVSRGEEIGSLDTVQLHLQKLQMESNHSATLSRRTNVGTQVAGLRAQLDKQYMEKQRMEGLIRDHAGNRKALDDILSQIDVLKRQIVAQEALLSESNSSLTAQGRTLMIQKAQVDDQLHKSRIVSPVAGTILEKYMEQGELATQGRPLFKVADITRLYLRAYVTDEQYNRLKLGQQVKVYADEGKGTYRSYPGVITWIASEAEFTPKTIQTKDERDNLVYAVKIRVKNDGRVKIGMYGEVDF